MGWRIVPDHDQRSSVPISQLTQESSRGNRVAVSFQFHYLHLPNRQAHRRVVADLLTLAGAVEPIRSGSPKVPSEARFMVFLAGLWVEVAPVFEALSAGAGSWSMLLSSGVRGISRRFSDNGLKRGTLCRRPWHRSERGLTSNEDRQ